MAISFTRPDPSSPSSVASASFTSSRKGFEQAEVREFLRMVAAELARLQERERFLERELRTAQRGASPSAIALDDELVTKMLGEEAARILHTAREAATQIKVRAEEGAGRLLREATDEAQRLREEAEIEGARRRQDASADAESEVEMAKQQGRDMVNEARAYRERVLNELARRRELARQQIEQLMHGRDRLLQAFERSRLVAVDVMAELTPLGEPSEYVDLSPTTGPVPLMVKNMPRPGRAAAAAEPVVPADAADVAPVEPVAPVEVAEVEVEVAETEPGEAPVAHVYDVEVDEPESETTATDVAGTATDVAGAPAEPVASEPDTVVKLDISPAVDVHEHVDEDREPAPVVNLFAGELDVALDRDGIDEAEPNEPSRASADDLFARLRAARADAVAQRAIEAIDAEAAAADAAEPASGQSGAPVEQVTAVVAGEDSVFLATAEAPTVVDEVIDDSAFARRDEVLTPLIVAAARKLKRVLADEQNEVLHVLRRKAPVSALDDVVAAPAEQAARYVASIATELAAAAQAGAMSMGMSRGDATKAAKRSDASKAAGEQLVTELVEPLRDRLARCVADANGDNDELASLVRLVYREWKGQRIDEHLDDVARVAFGHGALAGVTPGTPICWVVDPHGPQCPDAEDNALAGVVGAGEPFPTEHTCAPAHSGCRCMIVPAGG